LTLEPLANVGRTNPRRRRTSRSRIFGEPDLVPSKIELQGWTLPGAAFLADHLVIERGNKAVIGINDIGILGNPLT